MDKTLLLIFILSTLETYQTIYVTVCDCKNTKTRGILDINSPYYCEKENPDSRQHQPRFQTSYTLMTKQKPVKTWKGWTCKQWVRTKKITGSFWIGSFDTVFSQETKLISPLECWEMINDRKCGGNIMQASPTSLSFTATPTGEGAWYATREYHVLNCLAEEITLRQETPESQIESPFGYLNATQQDGQVTQNHNTIVWGERSSNISHSQTIFKGVGFLELTQTSEIVNTSRLLDKNRQIEITFYNKPDNENKELAQPATMKLYKLYKNTLSSSMDQTNIDSWACNEYATTKRSKRSIQQEVKFLLNQPFEEELGKRLYSISYAWGSIRLGHPKLTRNGNKEKQDTIIYIKISDAQKQVTVHNQYDIEEKLIRNTSTCITITETNNIIPEPCSENTSRWVFDTINYQLISMEKHLCITLKDEDKGSNQSLILQKCSRPENMDDNQQWVFQTVNTNPEVLENFPETTIDELEEIRLEQRRAVATTINSPIFGGLIKFNHGHGNIIWDMISWGLLKNGKPPNEKCVTYNGKNTMMTLEECDPNWPRCQKSLQKLVTSNDPLVQTQTTVANCSRALNRGQAFEYSSDFTIRPFNTNNCIKANTTMLVLQECSNTSSVWGTFEHTGQLMATDRTGLHSPASDRKCLTLKVGRLSLGHCHGSIKRQHISFEYKNPHQMRTLSAAAIIALHTQQPINEKNEPTNHH
ncbi:hypothetical protein GHT06_020246 [Daphnia sinensis]|uniref:Ricin B lectin domain-containing protein n=1 Tax=Daphnia sinensis TaxID=1820382 RepID=A0AAD5KMB9_9CRUS|nr:hypothetical protein GHT06_020246 [Daphnia sinensis]